MIVTKRMRDRWCKPSEAKHLVMETEPSGHMFDFTDPKAEQIALNDMARALSMTCRFGGHCKRFYSVAEHSCRVAGLLKDGGFPPDVVLAGLLHDGHEAYLGDAPTGLKDEIKRIAPGAWEALEHKVDAAIGEALGHDVRLFHCDPVKAADKEMLLIEAGTLKTSKGIGPHWYKNTVAREPRPDLGWEPWRAQFRFLSDYKAYLHHLAADDRRYDGP